MRLLNLVRTLLAALLLAGGLGALAYGQGFIGIFQDGSAGGPSVRGVTSALSGLFFRTGAVGVSLHLEGGQGNGTTGLPVLSTCGTSPVLGTGSSDLAGKITVGTSASNACTLTFGTAYTTAPSCVVQNATLGSAANVYAVAVGTIIWSSALADSTVLYYHCIAPAGG